MITRRLFNQASLLGLFNPFYPTPSPQEEPLRLFEIYDDSVVESACTAIQAGSRRKRLIGLSPKWCPHCNSKNAPKFHMKSNDYYEIEWLEQDSWEGVKPPQYPAVIDTETRCQFFGNAISFIGVSPGPEAFFARIEATNQQYESQGLLKLPQRSTSIVPAIGKIDRRIIDGLLLIKTGQLSMTHDPYEYVEKSMALRFPSDVGFQYQRMVDSSQAKLTFRNKPSIRLLNLIEQKIDGFTVTPDSFTINLRLFPDIPLDVV